MSSLTCARTSCAHPSTTLVSVVTGVSPDGVTSVYADAVTLCDHHTNELDVVGTDYFATSFTGCPDCIQFGRHGSHSPGCPNSPFARDPYPAE